MKYLLSLPLLCIAASALSAETSSTEAQKAETKTTKSASALLNALRAQSHDQPAIKKAENPTDAASESISTGDPAASTAILTGSPSLTAQFAHPVMPTEFEMISSAPVPVIAVPTDLLAALSTPQPAPVPEIDPKQIDINKANAIEFEEKLKLDPRRARMIVEYRTVFGRFGSTDDLTQVSGISDEQVVGWEKSDLLYIKPPDTISQPISY